MLDVTDIPRLNLPKNTTVDTSIILTERQLCDLELLFSGAFFPLHGFMVRADYESVLSSMRLCSGVLWPIPITLDLFALNAKHIQIGDAVVLCDQEGTQLAILNVSDKWKPDKKREALAIFGTTDVAHPGVDYLFNKAGEFYVGGSLTQLGLPKHYDFKTLRLTPLQTQALFKKRKWEKVVGFQTRNPMHRAHIALTHMAMHNEDAALLIHPVVGLTKPGDIRYCTRIRCYEAALKAYPENTAMLALLPLAMRMAGPKEALWHAIIRKNYGCTHFIVGRDHAGPGADSHGNPFYAADAAQKLVLMHQDEIGIKIIPFSEVQYDKKSKRYLAIEQITNDCDIAKLSGTQFRAMLYSGDQIPSWFSLPEVIAELRKIYPPRIHQGFTVFFTGLSGAGKSTIANALLCRLNERNTDRTITLLDGDVVRTLLSSKLGFSKEDRELNIRRITYVASEITRHRGIAICAPIAPYAASRDEARKLIGSLGGFFEIYISTPLTVCRKRDPKGLYKKVDAGIIKNFTGIDDPYEAPVNPDLEMDTTKINVDDAVEKIIEMLFSKGYLSDETC